MFTVDIFEKHYPGLVKFDRFPGILPVFPFIHKKIC